MNENLISSAPPHIHTKDSSRRIMLDVVLALVPACIASVILYGLKALLILLVCVGSCVLAEACFNALTKKDQTIGDLSAVVTGVLLGLNLSTNAALWQCVIGSVFAIVFVKCMFGGLGHNFANPAISGRVFMLIAFSSVAGGAAPAMIDAVSSATPLQTLASGTAAGLPSFGQMFLGMRGGAIGEGCILALLLGYAYLVLRRVVKWYLPVIFIGTVFALCLFSSGSFTHALYEILAGGLFLGAIFMATDYVTTPITARGRMLFALGCGVLTFLIRRFTAYPEGVSFSILAMNLLSPWLENISAKKPLGGA
ncbi:MAG: RnfABCDGE type electron transport complex subunit D [Oscillospiraceae bacterium]|nr:RnfABCDGE type electron transport complex subunit D [Oscillospiraceae bacterium]